MLLVAVFLRALLLTLALILSNGLVNTFHPWAPPLLQAVALLLPPSLYFFTASVRRGAYLSRRERHPLGAALFFLADGAVLAAVAAMRLAAGEAIARAGQLTEAALPLGLALFFLYLGAVLLWQLRREKAQGDE